LTSNSLRQCAMWVDTANIGWLVTDVQQRYGDTVGEACPNPL